MTRLGMIAKDSAGYHDVTDVVDEDGRYVLYEQAQDELAKAHDLIRRMTNFHRNGQYYSSLECDQNKRLLAEAEAMTGGSHEDSKGIPAQDSSNPYR